MSVRYLNATGTQALIDTIKQRLSTKADQSSINAILQQLSALAQQIPTNISQLNNDAEYVTKTQADEDYATSADINSLASVVTQNHEALNILNSDSTTPGSVDYKIDQALGTFAPGIAILKPSGGSTWNYPDAGSPLSSELVNTLLTAEANAYLLPFAGRRGNYMGGSDMIFAWKGESSSVWFGICLSDPSREISGPYPFFCSFQLTARVFTWWELGSTEPASISIDEIEALF